MIVCQGYVVAVERGDPTRSLVLETLKSAPSAPDGYTYKLRADNLELELVKMLPVEPEPLTDEEAFIRYANELTGANDPDLISAAETLITDRIKEDM